MQPALEPSFPADDLSLIIGADPASVRAGLADLLARPPMSFMSDDARGTAELVLAEVLNNVAEHAYPHGPGTIAITVSGSARGLDCLVVDDGVAMPGNALPEGRLPGLAAVSLDDLPEGGFGWHLIRSLTEGLSYERQQGQNRLRFLLPAGA
jgi:serine/threonine-protein kinase RsbW